MRRPGDRCTGAFSHVASCKPAMPRWPRRREGRGMEVSAWRNGQHSANTMYGLAIPRAARDRFFDRSWPGVIVVLPNGDEGTASPRPTVLGTLRQLPGGNISLWLRHG